jgi:L-rhamnose mutarotase
MLTGPTSANETVAGVYALQPRHFFPKDPAVRQVATPRRGMGQLIERLELSGKRIISLGADIGNSDYWLHNAGCQLLLVDDAGKRGLKQRLQYVGTPVDKVDPAAVLSYVLCAPGDVSWLPGPYDACIMKGDGIADGTVADTFLRSLGFDFDIKGASPALLQAIMDASSWPHSLNVFSVQAMEFAKAATKPGGLLIQIRTASGPKLPSASRYLQAARRQLAAHGFTLLEVHTPQLRPSQHIFVSLFDHGASELGLNSQPPARQLQTRTSLSEFAINADRSERLLSIAADTIPPAPEGDQDLSGPRELISTILPQRSLPLPERWMHGLKAAGQAVVLLNRPFEQALQRYALEPTAALCLGTRSELIGCALYERQIPVALHSESPTRTWPERETDATVTWPVELNILKGWSEALQLPKAARNLIVAADSVRELNKRQTEVLRWSRRLFTDPAAAVPDFLDKEFLALVDHNLAPGGLLILETRTGDIDLRRYPGLWDRLIAELGQFGIAPVELYTASATPGLIQLTAIRGTERAASQAARAARSRAKITNIHTYGEVDTRCQLIWNAADQRAIDFDERQRRTLLALTQRHAALKPKLQQAAQQLKAPRQIDLADQWLQALKAAGQQVESLCWPIEQAIARYDLKPAHAYCLGARAEMLACTLLQRRIAVSLQTEPGVQTWPQRNTKTASKAVTPVTFVDGWPQPGTIAPGVHDLMVATTDEAEAAERERKFLAWLNRARSAEQYDQPQDQAAQPCPTFFKPDLLALLDRHLAPGGVFLFEDRSGNLDLRLHQDIWQQLVSELASVGLHPVELSMLTQAPGLVMLTAIKADAAGATALANAAKQQNRITHIHTYTEVSSRCALSWTAASRTIERRRRGRPVPVPPAVLDLPVIDPPVLDTFDPATATVGAAIAGTAVPAPMIVGVETAAADPQTPADATVGLPSVMATPPAVGEPETFQDPAQDPADTIVETVMEEWLPEAMVAAQTAADDAELEDQLAGAMQVSEPHIEEPPLREIAEVWMQALLNAGHDVESIVWPFERALERYDLKPRAALCAGERSELLGCTLLNRQMPVTVITELNQQAWLQRETPVAVKSSAPVVFTAGWERALGLPARECDLIVVANSPSETAERDYAMPAWRRSAAGGSSTPPPAFFGKDMLAAIDRNLAPGGLFLFEGRTGELDLRRYHAVWERLVGELADIGMTPVELLTVTTAPGLIFLAAVRGDAATAAKIARSAKDRVAISHTHTYADISSQSQLIWDAATRPAINIAELQTAAASAATAASENRLIQQASLPDLWRRALKAAGQTVETQCWPVEQALERYNINPQTALCSGERGEMLACMLLGRDVAVTLINDGYSNWPQRSADPALLAAASAHFVDRWPDRPLAQAPFDLIVVASSPGESAGRDATMPLWRPLSDAGEVQPVPDFFGRDLLTTIDQQLAPGGMLLFEGRTSGVDLRLLPMVWDKLVAELASVGMAPVELSLVSAAPGLILLAAVRGDQADAAALAELAKTCPRISHIHTYIEISSRSEFAWNAADQLALVNEAQTTEAHAAEPLRLAELSDLWLQALKAAGQDVESLCWPVEQAMERYAIEPANAICAGERSELLACTLLGRQIPVTLITETGSQLSWPERAPPAAVKSAAPVIFTPGWQRAMALPKGEAQLLIVAGSASEAAVRENEMPVWSRTGRLNGAPPPAFFSRDLLSVLDRNLAPGGMFIFEGRTGEVDLRRQPAVWDCLVGELASIGLSPVEVSVVLAAPGLIFMAAIRGDTAAAEEVAAAAKSRPQIAHTHTYAEVNTQSQTIWNAAEKRAIDYFDRQRRLLAQLSQKHAALRPAAAPGRLLTAAPLPNLADVWVNSLKAAGQQLESLCWPVEQALERYAISPVAALCTGERGELLASTLLQRRIAVTLLNEPDVQAWPQRNPDQALTQAAPLAFIEGWTAGLELPAASKDLVIVASSPSEAGLRATAMPIWAMAIADGKVRPVPQFFSAELLAVLDRTLAPGGLLLFEGRTGEVDLRRHPQVWDQLAQELAVIGMLPVEISVVTAAPGLILLTAIRGDAAAAKALAATARDRTRISHIHTYTEVSSQSDLIWNAADQADADEAPQATTPVEDAQKLAELSDLWMQALKAAGNEVESLCWPVEQAINRFALNPVSAICAGERSELLACTLLRRKIPVALVSESSAQAWPERETPAAVQSSAPVVFTPGWERALALPAGAYDLIVVASSPSEGALRERQMPLWQHATEAGQDRPVPDFFSPELLAVVDRSLAPGGYFLFEGRTGEVDLRRHPAVWDKLVAELADVGITPVELSLSTAAPGLIFLVAIRADHAAAVYTATSARQQQRISHIHTYAEINSQAEIAWNAAEQLPIGQADRARLMSELAADRAPLALPDRPVAELSELWMHALKAAGQPVESLCWPIEQAMARYELQPTAAICVGQRSEPLACKLLGRQIPVALISEADERPFPGREHAPARSSTPLIMSHGWGHAMSLPAASRDLIAVVGSTTEAARRDRAMPAWQRAVVLENKTGLPVPDFFGSELLTLLAHSLVPGGMLLFEGRTGEIDIRRYPAVWDRMVAELTAIGLAPVELSIVNAAPGLILLAAVRGDATMAAQIAGNAKARSRVTHTHTYSEINTASDLIWNAADGRLIGQYEPASKTKPARPLTVPELAEQWFKALNDAGQPVALYSQPYVQALERYARTPANALCLGLRGEAIACTLLRRKVPVRVVKDMDLLSGTANANQGSQKTSAAEPALAAKPAVMTPLQFATGWTDATAQDAGPRDLVVVASSPYEEVDRDKHLPEWRRQIEELNAPPGPVPPFFHPELLALLDRALAPGAMLIIEARTGEIDFRHYPQVWERVQSELAALTLAPVELYIVRSAPGLMLLTAVRADAATAARMATESASRPGLTDAHTYAEVKSRASLIWSAIDGTLAPRPPRIRERVFGIFGR